MSGSTPSSRPGERGPPDDLLYGFDICDEETKQFLSSLVSSGRAPHDDVEELRQLSLMRGVDEWDMLFTCALTLQMKSNASRRFGGTEREDSLVPFLGAVLEGRTSDLEALSQLEVGHKKPLRGTSKRKLTASRNNRRGKSISHFWAEAGDASAEPPSSQCQAGALAFGCSREGSSGNTQGTAGKQNELSNGAIDNAVLPEAQGPSPILPPPDQEIPSVSSRASSDAVSGEDAGFASLDLPNATVCSSSKPRKDAERVLKATGGSRSPFFGTPTPTWVKQPASDTLPTKKKTPRPPRGTVSSLPIPPLSADRFGLIQEELADDPFRLLIAVTFLIRTTGKAAIPVFCQLMDRFPTPEALAGAEPTEIISLIRPLGLSAVRCAAIQKYARVWLEKPPTREVRYGVKNYPRQGDGHHVRVGEEFGPEGRDAGEAAHSNVDAVTDTRERAIGGAWEIGHLTQGPYALDSWRIFCRDVLLGRSDHWTGKGGKPGFQPEWMRVLPRDKELRACLRWMWMREGWEWDPLTGEREPLREEMRRAVDEGRVGYDNSGNLVILCQNEGSVG
ncbi:uncharacterized protein B0T15DRAFT_489039 [Chaetomium strumarium]|uniref:HhH-GPD domain-containing protein n=1 Tax=Chaetomium strumarium TaxID=1170767 RepID=A0AAJ0M660_9PEZI|nr:hypothetical protein B0T15DRAFT_489039 [Chaetomium strumarium]